MIEPVRSSLVFLVHTLFDIYSFVFIIRIFLVYSGANYFDPITQFVIRFTNFIVKYVRTFIPTYKNIEYSSILIVFTLEITKFLLLALIMHGMIPSLLGILLLSAGDFLKLIFLTLFYCILLHAILSWVQPNSPLNISLFYITSPILKPIQRFVPAIAGIDISPLIALIILQLLIILLASPMMAEGLNMGYSMGI